MRLRLAAARDGVSCSGYSRSLIDTPGLAELMSSEQKTEAVSHVPLGRLGTPDDTAKVAVFLASDDSAYVNGIELFADGGVAQY